MEALTAVTDTFVFPLSSTTIYFARDTEEKRNQLEPNILLTVPLPDAANDKDMVDVANAVRSVLNLTIVWLEFAESYGFYPRSGIEGNGGARAAGGALTAETTGNAGSAGAHVGFRSNYHYGVALPTSFQLADFGHINHFQSIMANIGTFGNFSVLGEHQRCSVWALWIRRCSRHTQNRWRRPIMMRQWLLPRRDGEFSRERVSNPIRRLYIPALHKVRNRYITQFHSSQLRIWAWF